MKKRDLLIALILLFGLSTNIMAQIKKVTDTRLKEVQTEVDELNAKIKKNGLSWKAGVTSVSLLTDEEKIRLCGVPYQEKNTTMNYPKHIRRNAALKKSAQTEGVIVSLIDWMSPVSFQGLNGNCYVHATMGLVEAELHRFHGQNIGIILDDWYLTVRSGGDQGGDPATVLNVIKENKVPSLGVNSFPNFDGAYWTITRDTMESDLKALLDDGKPVEVRIDTCYSSFFNYQSGVYEPTPGDDYLQVGYTFGHDPLIPPIGHAIVVIGYGIEDNKEYWLCRNSWYISTDSNPWGSGHGDPKYNGYFKIRKGRCGVCLDATTGYGYVVYINEPRCLAKVVPGIFNLASEALSYDFVDKECAYLNGSSTISNPTTLNFTTNNSLTFINNGTLQINNRLEVNSDGKIIGSGVLSIGSLGQVVFNNSSALMARNDIQLNFPSSFRNYLSLTLNPASYPEGGTGGTYKVNNLDMGTSWSGNVITDHSIPLEAIRPNGYIAKWSDNSTVNPRTLTPTSNMILNAIYTSSSIAPPHAKDANPITSTTFTANWTDVSAATKYYLDVASVDAIFGNELPLLTNNDVGKVTSYQVTNLKPNTIYHYRLRSYNLNNGGQQSINSNTVTVITPLPPPPALALPANNTPNVIISPPPTVSWYASEGATGYVLQLSIDNFQSIVFWVTKFNPDNRSYTFQPFDLAFSINTKYYWRVKANNASSCDWSDVWSFTTAPATPSAPAPPSPPTATAATNIDSWSFIANWTLVDGATRYYIDVASDDAFTSNSLLPAYTNLNVGCVKSYSVTGLDYNTTYHFRVRSCYEVQSPNSNMITVTTIPPPPTPTPTLVSPANGAKNLSALLRLIWSSVSGVQVYRLQVSTNASFSSTQINTLFSDTTGQVHVENDTTYFWRVRAMTPDGNPLSTWSQVCSFTTILAGPTIPAPYLNGAKNLSASLTLSWGSVIGAQKYNLQVSTNASFSSTQINTFFCETSVRVRVENNTTYFWRVRATTTLVDTLSDWSSVGSFTTIVAGPTLLSPANGAKNIYCSPTLSWSSVSGAKKIRLWVSTDSSSTSTPMDWLVDGDLEHYSLGSIVLVYNTKYYWHVQALIIGDGGYYCPLTDVSSVWSFTTAPAVPPVLTSPTNYASVSVPTNLTWTVTPGASTYCVQIGTSSDFSNGDGSLIIDDSSVTSNSYAVVLAGNHYYWRVMAKNSEWSSSWSTTSSFYSGGVVWSPTTTWSGIYRLAESIEVPSDVTLNIAPGTKIILQNDAVLTVNGKLNIQGTPNDSVRIESSSQDAMLSFTQASEGSIEYAAFKSTQSFNCGCAINLAGCKYLAVNNCTFINLNTGISIYRAIDSVVVRNCQFSNSGYGIQKSNWSGNLLISNVTFSGNGIAIALNRAQATIQGCKINTARSNIGVRISESTVLIESSTITGTSRDAGMGISFGDGYLTLRSSRISGFYTGVNISFGNPDDGFATIGENLGNGTGGNIIENCYTCIAVNSSYPPVTIKHNIIRGFSNCGIYTLGGSCPTIENNNIGEVGATNAGTGIEISGDEVPLSIKLNRFTGCYVGIGGNSVSCRDNNFELNTYHVCSSYASIANNWWNACTVAGIWAKLACYSYSTTFQPFYTSPVSGTGPYGSNPVGLAKLVGEDSLRMAKVVELPKEFAIGPNVPNPFNPTTVINYQLPDVGTRFIVSLKIYDMLGREVVVLVDATKEAGYYKATFNASHLSSGIYFARLVAQSDVGKPFVKTIKLLLTK
ncbi:MAG: right-handed parallel beta-helix repeat-containing protein [Bacteroidota bacterium]